MGGISATHFWPGVAFLDGHMAFSDWLLENQSSALECQWSLTRGGIFRGKSCRPLEEERLLSIDVVRDIFQLGRQVLWGGASLGKRF